MAVALNYAPSFQIQINGGELPAAVRASVSAVRYQDGIGVADRVEIDLANADLMWLQKHIRGLGFRPFPTALKVGPIRPVGAKAAGTFDIDNKLELSIGYAPDPLERVFLGEITGLQASFPSDGVPTLTIVAHDFLHRLSKGKYARGFGPLPDFLIASILSAENLLIPAIDPAVGGASIAMMVLNEVFKGGGRKQKGKSDLELLKAIAAQYDADFWVDGSVLYLSRFIKEYAPRLTLRWGQSLLDFAPKVSTIGQVARVGVRFSLRVIPLDFLVVAFWDFDRESLGVTVVPGQAAHAMTKSLVGPMLTLIDRPISNPADIVNSAIFIIRKLRQKVNNRLTGTGSAVGDPRIRAGAVIKLDDLGPDFSGNYRVSAATHTLDGNGYRTSFNVRKEILP